jgi:CheY-like chemotaxis protein/predicted Ser/Thr protein kinase
VLDDSARILVVEDDPLMREFFVEALASEGYAVEEANDGIAASDLLIEKSFDLVLSDINLPGLSGIELFRRNAARAAGPAVILITGAPSVDDAVATIKEGACDYLTKPVTIDRLAACVKAALEKRRTTQAQAGASSSVARAHQAGYRFIRTLGFGTFATVFLVEQDGQHYAMKILKALDNCVAQPDMLVRFLHEGEVVSSLDHDGIVKVFEYGIGPGYPYPFILMEYVDGDTLTTLIEKRSMVLEAKLDIIAQISEALAVVHAHGVLHRDVKPGNVLVTRQGKAKIADFGIARLEVLVRAQGEKHVMGTPAYMAPERSENDAAADHRADIFSLGVLCYQLLTGQFPFTEAQWPALQEEIANSRPIAPRKLDSTIPPPIERILAGMLQKAPAARYQAARDIRADIEHFRAGGWEVADSCGPCEGGIPTDVWR